MNRGVVRSALACALCVPVAVAALTVVPATRTPVADASGQYSPLPEPRRLLDTRGGATFDGQFSGNGPVQANETLELKVTGRAGVAGSAGSVVLNVTATDGQQDGYVTVYPCGSAQPEASNLNFRPAQTIPNAVIAKIGSGGQVCFFTSATVHLVVDVAGVFPPNSYSALPQPRRLVDTRGGRTFDDLDSGGGQLGAGATLELTVAGRAGVPVSASSAVLNVTIANAQGGGFATVYPCGTPQPEASNLNFESNQTIPNAVVTKIGTGGRVCVFSSAQVDVLVDVAGVLPDWVFTPLAAPARLLDTRVGPLTIDRRFRGGGTQPSNTAIQLDVAGRAGLPMVVAAVVLNVTAVAAVDGGYATVYPQGASRPEASNLNFDPGQTMANLVVAALGSRGDICLATVGASDYIVDVVGYLAGPPPIGPEKDCTSVPASYAPTSDLVRFADLHRGIGHDRIAVWVCDVPLNTKNGFYEQTAPLMVDENAVAGWANAQVAPYFSAISQERYSAVFAALGRIPLSVDGGPDDCLDSAEAATGGSYTNVLATDTRDYAGGFGGPGLIYTYGLDLDVFEGGAPNQSRRGMWVGGGSTSEYLSPLVVAHEIGHTLHWPHSYIDAGFPYDNNLDLMSGAPIEGYCQSGGRSWPCSPPNTLAFNRFASGWFGGDRVVLHDTGTVNVTLDAPMGAGNQMVLVREAEQPWSMMSIEARPATGYDGSSQKAGVAVHLIDQRPLGTGQIVDGYSTRRRQRQAVGVSDSYAHVVGLGETLAAHGVTITVLANRGAGYVVQVAGTYRRPPDSFFEAIGRPIVDPCSGDDLMAALEAGCVR